MLHDLWVANRLIYRNRLYITFRFLHFRYEALLSDRYIVVLTYIATAVTKTFPKKMTSDAELAVVARCGSNMFFKE